MTEVIIAHTVADLIAELSKLPPDATVMSHEPPFTGVSIVPQHTGAVYISSLHDTPEGIAYRAGRKVPMMTSANPAYRATFEDQPPTS